MPGISRPVCALTSALVLSMTAWLTVAGAGSAEAAPVPQPTPKSSASPTSSPSPSHSAANAPVPAKTPKPVAIGPGQAPSQSTVPLPTPPPLQTSPAASFPQPTGDTPPPLTAPSSLLPPPKPVSVTPPSGKADDGSYIGSETWLDPRMADLKIGSMSVGAMVVARIIVPAGWSPTSNGETWPVLYLLHGGRDDYTSWTRNTDIESFVADKNVIVVMPENGPTGIPTRWWNGGKNKPDYESFDAVELMQLLERDFNASSTRAAAGVSSGAYGAVMMAAHFPGTFAAAASYSGILNTTAPGMPAVMRALVVGQNIQADALWGDPLHNVQVWNQDNPYAQATGLRWTSVFLSCGDGMGPSDDPIGKVLERAIEPQNIAFAARLNTLGIPVQTAFYPGEVHNWGAWRIAFAASWPLLAASLGLPS